MSGAGRDVLDLYCYETHDLNFTDEEMEENRPPSINQNNCTGKSFFVNERLCDQRVVAFNRSLFYCSTGKRQTIRSKRYKKISSSGKKIIRI